MELARPPVTVVVVAPADRIEALVGLLVDGDGDGGDATVQVVGTTDAAGASETVAQGAPDVVVTVAGADELAATGRVAADSPGTRVLVVGSDDPSSLVRGGVGAVVDESTPAGELRGAVVGLALGEARLDAGLAGFVRERISSDGSALVPLTDTEDEVLGRLSEGATVESLAETYAVSARLVRQVAGGALARVVLADLIGT